MGLAQIKMPQLGESVTEGTVDKWLKREGDMVKRDEPLVEVVTDKVNAEIPSPFEGKLVKISATEGETVRVGAVIAQIEVQDAAGAGPQAAAKPSREAGVAHTEVPPEPAGGPAPGPTEVAPPAGRPRYP
jgi:pyruvate/2-oxoglutarate dehydrogenase complex dihydrolipoamide acyltransferase (E2) component